jgi:polysaccharide export outer membrane protein
MKKSLVFYLVLLIVIQFSCTNTKEILMFQETDKDLKQLKISTLPVEHKIKPFDNLYVSILTVDQEVNKTFNPSKTGDGYGSGTDQMYGTPTGKYLNGYIVASDSTITLPNLGKINLVGLNLEEAQMKVKTRAEELLKDPVVQLKYLNFWVNVSGEIKSPGIYYNFEGNLNILDAIGMANGITEFADLKNVLVKRQSGNKVSTFKINLTNNSVYMSEAFFLNPNDLVYIPPSNLKRRTLNSDTYNKFLGTVSVLLLSATLILNLK